MADIVNPEVRSQMMASISGRDTTPEKLIRSGLHRLGRRFRLHDKKLPGRPDIVFSPRQAVIEVRGCFWHGHDCALFKWPRTRAEFWRAKILDNIKRDERNRTQLFEMGWRVAEVWECQLKGRQSPPLDSVLNELCQFLEGSERHLVIGKHETVTLLGGA